MNNILCLYQRKTLSLEWWRNRHVTSDFLTSCILHDVASCLTGLISYDGNMKTILEFFWNCIKKLNDASISMPHCRNMICEIKSSGCCYHLSSLGSPARRVAFHWFFLWFCAWVFRGSFHFFILLIHCRQVKTIV